jgi:pimeloyl-ACP methyl ester carboxylesterase
MTIPNHSCVRLHYERQGRGLPVVLLHGYCGSSRYWREIVPALSSRYDVIMPDLRGHGASPATDEGYSMEQLADDVAGLLDELRLERVYLFGHSLGGYITLAFAERYADRLLGFGLVHSTSLPDTEAGREGRLKTIEQIRREGVQAFVDGLIPKLFATEHRQKMAAKIEEAKAIGAGTSTQGAIGCALGMRDRTDRTHVLVGTTLPVLLLAGAEDEIVAPDRRFPAAAPHITALALPEVGHMGMMEAPEPFVSALLAFLDGNKDQSDAPTLGKS